MLSLNVPLQAQNSHVLTKGAQKHTNKLWTKSLKSPNILLNYSMRQFIINDINEINNSVNRWQIKQLLRLGWVLIEILVLLLIKDKWLVICLMKYCSIIVAGMLGWDWCYCVNRTCKRKQQHSKTTRTPQKPGRMFQVNTTSHWNLCAVFKCICLKRKKNMGEIRHGVLTNILQHLKTLVVVISQQLTNNTIITID